MALKILRLNREDSESWHWVPFTLERIEKFCHLMDTESEPSDVSNLVRTLFVVGDPRLGLWIAVEDDQVVAHLLATPEPWGENRWKYCLIRQAWIDKGVNTMVESDKVFQEVKVWAKSMGLSRLVMLTHRDEAAFMRRWGFRLYKSLMSMET
jgi:hypothetical protein